ncbi:MAG: hypothetical protein AABW67_06565 [Nanoarchaeota archaeon]
MLFKYKYPKLTLLAISIILAYVLFTNEVVKNFLFGLDGFGYAGVFVAGMLFPLGFTTAFSVGFLVYLNPENIILSAFIGAIGVALANLLIFSFVKFSFENEFFILEERIERVKVIREAEKEFKKDVSKRIRHYLMYMFIGILIASPVPDEIADALLAGFTHVKPFFLAIFSFILSFIGLLFLLWI